MIIADLPQYREATIEQLMAYADTMGVAYETDLTADLTQNKHIISDMIIAHVLEFQRLKAIEVDVFIPGRILAVGQLALLLQYDQLAPGLAFNTSEPDVWDKVDDDNFNYMIQTGVGDYIRNSISTFNTAISSTSLSGIYWTSDNQQEIIPCTAQNFKYHVWGTGYDSESSGCFHYPQATSAMPEGWEGVGMGVNLTPLSGTAIDYFNKFTPPTGTGYWDAKDILYTGFPNATHSNQSIRSATNSLVVRYFSTSGA